MWAPVVAEARRRCRPRVAGSCGRRTGRLARKSTGRTYLVAVPQDAGQQRGRWHALFFAEGGQRIEAGGLAGGGGKRQRWTPAAEAGRRPPGSGDRRG